MLAVRPTPPMAPRCPRCRRRRATRTSMPDDSGTGRKRMSNPPILISVLGFFGALAGFYWLYLGLRLLGFDWFGIFGDVPKFEQTGLWGWLAIAGGIAEVAGAGALWALRPGRALVAPAVGLAVRDDHGRDLAVRGVPVVPRPPGIGRRLRRGRDAAGHH